MAELTPDLVLATCVENNGPMLLAIGWALLALALITVLLRVIFRHRYGNGLHADDYTMMASIVRTIHCTLQSPTPSTAPPLTNSVHQACGITAVILLTLFVNAGFGRHIYCLPPSALPDVFKYSILAQIFNIAGIGLVKISVCLHILRIINRGVRCHISLLLWLLILITFLSHLAQILLFCVQCRPMPAIWSPQEYPDAKCFSSHITYLAGYIGFGLDAFTDLVTAIIPIVVIRSLQMNARTKTALCILMGLGVLTAVCAVAKAITLQGVFAEDYTWALWRPGLCTIIEHLAGMIIASAPALNPLFKRALRSPSTSGSKGSRSSGKPGRRLDGERNERQTKRVSRWADAWTPPNVHVAHYSPYASERKCHGWEGGQWTENPRLVDVSHVTDDSDVTAVGSERNGARGEITKTVSFRRESEHTEEAEMGGVGTGGGGQDDGDAVEDRLWIGNGYWGLPPAPGLQPVRPVPSPGTEEREGRLPSPPPSAVGNPPHPAVGRWVRSGGEKPGPRAAGFGEG